MSPREGATVGVGMPISVTFDREIKNRAEVEQALTVYTPTPIEGAWSWSSPSQVQFRPKEYWPANIDVTVDLDLKGVEAAKRVYGARNTSTTFSIGPRMITQVDAQSHTATVFRDGERVRAMPITTGKAGFETRSGVKVIVSKERTRLMDAATGGTDPSDPEYYSLEVEYAMRVTYSGEFLHAAPWSVGSQGSANVSHGCVGMSTANAQWLYDLSNVGDVVEVTGTSSPQNLGNGITVWNEGWKEWLADSTSGPVMTVAAPGAPEAEASTPSDGPQEGSEGPADESAVLRGPAGRPGGLRPLRWPPSGWPGPDDRAAVVHTVLRAFDRDPAWRFMLGADYGRLAPLMAGALFDQRVGEGTVWVCDDGAAVAMWDAPGRHGSDDEERAAAWREFHAAAGPSGAESLAPLRRSPVRRRARRAALVPGRAGHRSGPVGERPGHGGDPGPGLARADEDGLACCLETSTASNRDFYRRRGFTQVDCPCPSTAVRRPGG